MEKPFRNTWEIYTGKFEKILILMLLTTLPLLIVHSFVSNYIYAITPSSSPIYSVADIYYGFLTLLFFLYAQIPYIRFIYNEYRGAENSLRNSIYYFFAEGFTVFAFACITAVLTTIGFMMFVIPGLILLALLMPVPYLGIMDGKSVWKSYKEGIRIGKKKMLKIILIVMVTGSIELMVGLFFTFQLFNITASFAAQVLTQMTLNLIFYPFIIMLLSSYIIKWRESLEMLEITEQETVI